MSTGVYNKITGFHNRRSIRLPGYDYSRPGYYFITFNIDNRAEHLLGEVKNRLMILSPAGALVEDELFLTESMRPNIRIDEFMIMPDHVHVIINIRDPLDNITAHAPKGPQTEQFGRSTSNSIPTIVRLIKSAATKQINALRATPGKPVWHRNYYERVIRDDKALFFIRRYIRNNPAKWDADPRHHLETEIQETGMIEVIV